MIPALHLGTPPANPPPSPRFGFAPKLGPVTTVARRAYGVIGSDPGLRILCLDLIGWCGLRTYIDYHRSWFLPGQLHRWIPFWPKKNVPGHPQGGQTNPAAAWERALREITATLSDNFAGTVVMMAAMPVLDKTMGLYTSRFVLQPHLRIFQSVAQGMNQQSTLKGLTGAARVDAFYGEVAEHLGRSMSLSGAQTREMKQLLTLKQFQAHAPQKGLKALFNRWFGLRSVDLEKLMASTHKILQRGDFDINVTGVNTSLPELYRDMAKISRRLEVSKSSGNWMAHFHERLSTSLWIRRWTPLLMFLPLIANLILPHLIQLFTIRKYATAQYPGEIGIQKGARIDFKNISDAERQKVLKEHYAKPWFEQSFPYLTEKLRNGNFLPLIPAMLFLPIMVGLYQVRGTGVAGLKPGKGVFQKIGNWLRTKLLNPGSKGFFRELSEKSDFSGRFHYASDQQQATTYASTLFSRIVTPRSAIEWRERTFDSWLSYWFGFMFTPAIEGKLTQAAAGQGAKGLLGRSIGRLSKRLFGDASGLMKSSTTPRSEYEILFGLKGAAQKAALTARTWLDIGLFTFTTFLMGVFEPILSIYLTGLQSNWQQKKAVASPVSTATNNGVPARHVLPAALAATQWLPRQSPTVASSRAFPHGLHAMEKFLPTARRSAVHTFQQVGMRQESPQHGQ